MACRRLLKSKLVVHLVTSQAVLFSQAWNDVLVLVRNNVHVPALKTSLFTESSSVQISPLQDNLPFWSAENFPLNRLRSLRKHPESNGSLPRPHSSARRPVRRTPQKPPAATTLSTPSWLRSPHLSEPRKRAAPHPWEAAAWAPPPLRRAPNGVTRPQAVTLSSFPCRRPSRPVALPAARL
jgi:hypothetical protein